MAEIERFEKWIRRERHRCRRLRCHFRLICYGWAGALLQMNELAALEEFLETKCPVDREE